jgi:EAL domain-containing protein (putative c-di-GMP-specific phosphodiesterase class I)
MKPRQERGFLGGSAGRRRPSGSVELLRRAIDRDGFVLFGQPIVELRSGRTVRHELLLRLVEEGQVISAREFLWAAELDGQIQGIDRRVVTDAVGLAARGMAVNVNISAQSIAPEFVEFVRGELAVTGVEPARLVFEVTESRLAENEAGGRAFAGEIRELGCGLALAHFGARRGGWTRLRGLAADYLKIDFEFIRDLSRDLGSRRVVERIVDLARRSGQTTVGEGVEDLATLQLLNELGVDQAQGFALGPPASVELTTPSESHPAERTA